MVGSEVGRRGGGDGGGGGGIKENEPTDAVDG